MSLKSSLMRLVGKYRRTVACRFGRKMMQMGGTTPIVSFTFDDAPASAFRNGGDILLRYGAFGTFYVSLGMLGNGSPSGTIAVKEDLECALRAGHELGCHTFDHIDPWKSSTRSFVESVVKNRDALSRILPGVAFRSLAYPFGDPKPSIKRELGKIFCCCRGGGQSFNKGSVDLNLVKSVFLDRRTGIDIDQIMALIDENAQSKGWLVFSTHDVAGDPSPYGCTMKVFDTAVRYSRESGATLVSVKEACEKINNGRFEKKPKIENPC